ncbi:phage recombination protein Bet, partial [Bifidobacterium panos]
MSSDLILTSEQDSFTERQMAALNALGVQDASQGDLALFLNQAQRTGLDPFSKQIYMIGRRQKVNGQWVTKQTIMVGIDGFRLIARRTIDRTHERYSAPDILWCDPKGGWHDAWIWDVPPVAAKATVVRGDGQFSAVALYKEYVGTRFDKQSGKQVPNSMWESKPALMLGKCAEALALRKAFPMELSGLYTSDEMQQSDNQTVQSAQADPVEETQSEDKASEEVPVQDGEVMATTG